VRIRARGDPLRRYRQGPLAREEDEVQAFMRMSARGDVDGRAASAPVQEPDAAPAAAGIAT
jgi:hypothetical protein